MAILIVKFIEISRDQTNYVKPILFFCDSNNLNLAIFVKAYYPLVWPVLGLSIQRIPELSTESL